MIRPPELFHRSSREEPRSDLPTLVLVHGSGETSEMWEAQMADLNDVANVVAIDMPAHGESGGDALTSVDELADAVVAWLAANTKGRVVVGGHSLGGAVAQAVALRRPPRLVGVALINTGAKLGVHPAIFAGIDNDYTAFIEGAPAVSASPSTPVSSLRHHMDIMLSVAPEVTAQDFRCCDAFDIRDRLKDWPADLPALIISADDDQMTPVKYGAYLAERLPKATFVCVERAGHLAPVEQPQAVSNALRLFLASLSN